jgi:hypothetical protein
MSGRKEDLPRDLRGLCGGVVRDPDGSERVLPFPVKAYFNLFVCIIGLQQWLEDFDGSVEDRETYTRLLEGAKADLQELKKRILDHFKVQPVIAGKSRASAGVDHGAKSKVEKALADIEAGIFDPSKKSMTMRAVFQAIVFNQKHGHMPSHQELMNEELMDIKFNDQQATDAGKWLAMQNQPWPNPIFPELEKERKGRQKKK